MGLFKYQEGRQGANSKRANGNVAEYGRSFIRSFCHVTPSPPSSTVFRQCRNKELLGTKPVHLFTKIISTRLLQEIRIGVYIYILISPELLVGRKFHKTLTNPTFHIHVGLVVINE